MREHVACVDARRIDPAPAAHTNMSAESSLHDFAQLALQCANMSLVSKHAGSIPRPQRTPTCPPNQDCTTWRVHDRYARIQHSAKSKLDRSRDAITPPSAASARPHAALLHTPSPSTAPRRGRRRRGVGGRQRPCSNLQSLKTRTVRASPTPQAYATIGRDHTLIGPALRQPVRKSHESGRASCGVGSFANVTPSSHPSNRETDAYESNAPRSTRWWCPLCST